MSKAFDAYIKACQKAVSDEKAELSPEFLAAAETIGEKVEKWGCEHGIMVEKKLRRDDTFFAAVEDFAIDEIDKGLGPQAVADLLADCGIAKTHIPAAAAKVGALLCQTLGREGQIAFADYASNDTTLKGDVVTMDALYGTDLWQAIQPGQEAFGINMDRVTPDLKTILTVALLQFHVSLTPRIVPIQTVTQSNVQITREQMEIFDMSKTEEEPARVLDLYRDPSMVSVKAIRIEPRTANDAAHEFLVADGIYKFEQELNLWKLALDATKPGFDKFNHTDLVEDGIVIDGVLVTITKAAEGETPAVSEQFMIPMDKQRARLTQVPNDHRSTERRLTLDHTTAALNAGSAVYGSQDASELLASFTNGKFLGIRLHLDAQCDRKTAEASASCWGKLVVRSADGAYVPTEEDKALLAKLSISFDGFTMDARYNEDNKRKTAIRAEINRQNLSYELPAGRNFVIDFAIGQEGAVNAAARLAQLEHIGRDGCNVKIVTDTLAYIHDKRMVLGNSAAANQEIAAPYAAGDLVHQIAYSGQLDYGEGFLTWRSSDAEGDIKQFAVLRLNKVVTGLLATSLITHQLAEGSKIVFRAITSPFILGTILSCHHIHQHLDGLSGRGQGDVEYVMHLDCGADIEFVTSTFMSMNDRIVLIPFFASAPTSVLNFGTDYDQGTLVGAVTLGADNSSAHNRMFSTTREALIPTDVIGASLEVTGLGDARIAGDFPGLVAPELPEPPAEEEEVEA